MDRRAAKVTEQPVLFFETPKEWRKWLHANHAKSNGVWLRFYKKGAGKKSVVYAEALDEALCYGWIDGQSKRLDDEAYVQRFTPRRAKSIWSKRNRDHVARLEKEGRMHDAGRAEVERAKADGRWDAAYDSPSNMELPEDFVKALAKNKKAKAFLATLNRANTYAIAFRLHHAKKPETRARRIETFIAKLAEETPIV
jgi:uncharacterized protein YdeI (YjbR/CyaY-like superfamily)